MIPSSDFRRSTSTKVQNSLKDLDGRLMQEIGRQTTDIKDHVSTSLDASSDRSVSRIKDHLSNIHVMTTNDFYSGFERAQAEYVAGAKIQAELTSEDISSRLSRDIKTSESRITDHLDRGLQKHRNELIKFFDQQPMPTQKAAEDSHRQEQKIQTSAGLIIDPGNRLRPDHQRTSDPLVAFEGQAACSFRQSPWRCQRGCQCTCHSLYRYSRWRLTSVSAVLGSLLISSCSGPRNFACTDPRCVRQSSSSWVCLDYRLPDWLLAITLSLCMSNGLGGPELLLRVVRRIAPESSSLPQSFYSNVRRGDIEGVKRLLLSRTVSVHDQWGLLSRTALWSAMNLGDVKMARLLLQAGSDPFEEHTVHMMLEWLHEGLETGRTLVNLFPFFTILDNYSYTSLHKIILGIQPLNLRKALQEPHFASQLNKRTLDGFTPMHLAACRGDTPAMQLMQAAGADIHSRASDQATLLHHACWKGSVSAVRLLLAAGLDPNATNIHGDSPLHFAAALAPPNLEVLALLVDAGADLKLHGNFGYTILFWSVYNQNLEALIYLIEQGADVNGKDHSGDTVLLFANTSQAHESVRTLLERGSDYTLINKYGQGILHHLAIFADEEILGIFLDWGLKRVDVERRDAKGRTAGDLLKMRENVSLEFRIKFHELLDGIRKAQAEAENAEECGDDGARVHDSSDDEFYDIDEA